MKSFMILMILVSTVWAERYPVFVSGMNMNMYMTADGYTIQTMMCTVTGNDIEAVLDYEPVRPYGNKLIFENSEECDVLRVGVAR